MALSFSLTSIEKRINAAIARTGNVFFISEDGLVAQTVGRVRNPKITLEPVETDPDSTGRPNAAGYKVIGEFIMMQTDTLGLNSIVDIAVPGINNPGGDGTLFGYQLYFTNAPKTPVEAIDEWNSFLDGIGVVGAYVTPGLTASYDPSQISEIPVRFTGYLSHDRLRDFGRSQFIILEYPENAPTIDYFMFTGASVGGQLHTARQYFYDKYVEVTTGSRIIFATKSIQGGSGVLPNDEPIGDWAPTSGELFARATAQYFEWYNKIKHVRPFNPITPIGIVHHGSGDYGEFLEGVTPAEYKIGYRNLIEGWRAVAQNQGLDYFHFYSIPSGFNLDYDYEIYGPVAEEFRTADREACTEAGEFCVRASERPVELVEAYFACEGDPVCEYEYMVDHLHWGETSKMLLDQDLGNAVGAVVNANVPVAPLPFVWQREFRHTTFPTMSVYDQAAVATNLTEYHYFGRMEDGTGSYLPWNLIYVDRGTWLNEVQLGDPIIVGTNRVGSPFDVEGDYATFVETTPGNATTGTIDEDFVVRLHNFVRPTSGNFTFRFRATDVNNAMEFVVTTAGAINFHKRVAGVVVPMTSLGAGTIAAGPHSIVLRADGNTYHLFVDGVEMTGGAFPYTDATNYGLTETLFGFTMNGASIARFAAFPFHTTSDVRLGLTDLATTEYPETGNYGGESNPGGI